LVHVIMFATALTSFIQLNTVTGSTDIGQAVTASQVFNLDSSLVRTDRLYYDVGTDVVAKSTSTKKIKLVKKTVPAIKIGQKLLVIKGYSEESVNIVNALEKENVILDTLPASLEDSINPAVVEVSVAEEVDTKVLDQEGDITEYEVVSGDTIASIAQKFNLTTETILWANDLKKDAPIHTGQKLVILPISGISYKVRNGDTVSEISEKFHVSQEEITEFNSIENGKLKVGETIIIPGGKLTSAIKTPPTNTPGKTTTSGSVKNNGYFSRPVIGGVRTQGIHGHNGIDIASSYGTPILSARDGYVSLVRGSDGWNGGYGNYVVVTHEKGIQTLYAHMSEIKVTQGQRVSKGQRVGSMGSTGQSTGVHLHFEVRGAKNPF
jgi:LysM repeat protein